MPPVVVRDIRLRQLQHRLEGDPAGVVAVDALLHGGDQLQLLFVSEGVLGDPPQHVLRDRLGDLEGERGADRRPGDLDVRQQCARAVVQPRQPGPGEVLVQDDRAGPQPGQEALRDTAEDPGRLGDVDVQELDRAGVVRVRGLPDVTGVDLQERQEGMEPLAEVVQERGVAVRGLAAGAEELLGGEGALADMEEVVRVQPPRLLVEHGAVAQPERERVRRSAAARAEFDQPVLPREAMAAEQIQEAQLPGTHLGIREIVRQLDAVEHGVEPAEVRHECLTGVGEGGVP